MRGLFAQRKEGAATLVAAAAGAIGHGILVATAARPSRLVLGRAEDAASVAYDLGGEGIGAQPSRQQRPRKLRGALTTAPRYLLLSAGALYQLIVPDAVPFPLTVMETIGYE